MWSCPRLASVIRRGRFQEPEADHCHHVIWIIIIFSTKEARHAKADGVSGSLDCILIDPAFQVANALKWVHHTAH
ncbi:hypothetical protein AC579_7640 [Pseudocercospora musae]|uniref:Uncharacterized protein n=1 Tax=Pseudocercospora musae TaxID=113226 RepID=A0A139IC91_9PEZI|nr:hypothetical protein AC579_7640 [Pseudocercospora musae]